MTKLTGIDKVSDVFVHILQDENLRNIFFNLDDINLEEIFNLLQSVDNSDYSINDVRLFLLQVQYMCKNIDKYFSGVNISPAMRKLSVILEKIFADGNLANELQTKSTVDESFEFFQSIDPVGYTKNDFVEFYNYLLITMIRDFSKNGSIETAFDFLKPSNSIKEKFSLPDYDLSESSGGLGVFDNKKFRQVVAATCGLMSAYIGLSPINASAPVNLASIKGPEKPKESWFKRNWRKNWFKALVIGGGILATAGLILGGYAIYRHVQKKNVDEQYDKAARDAGVTLSSTEKKEMLKENELGRVRFIEKKKMVDQLLIAYNREKDDAKVKESMEKEVNTHNNSLRQGDPNIINKNVLAGNDIQAMRNQLSKFDIHELESLTVRNKTGTEIFQGYNRYALVKSTVAEKVESNKPKAISDSIKGTFLGGAAFAVGGAIKWLWETGTDVTEKVGKVTKTAETLNKNKDLIDKVSSKVFPKDKEDIYSVNSASAGEILDLLRMNVKGQDVVLKNLVDYVLHPFLSKKKLIDDRVKSSMADLANQGIYDPSNNTKVSLLIGASGLGKTLTMNTIAKMFNITCLSVRVNDYDGKKSFQKFLEESPEYATFINDLYYNSYNMDGSQRPIWYMINFDEIDKVDDNAKNKILEWIRILENTGSFVPGKDYGFGVVKTSGGLINLISNELPPENKEIFGLEAVIGKENMSKSYEEKIKILNQNSSFTPAYKYDVSFLNRTNVFIYKELTALDSVVVLSQHLQEISDSYADGELYLVFPPEFYVGASKYIMRPEVRSQGVRVITKDLVDKVRAAVASCLDQNPSLKGSGFIELSFSLNSDNSPSINAKRLPSDYDTSGLSQIEPPLKEMTELLTPYVDSFLKDRELKNKNSIEYVKATELLLRLQYLHTINKNKSKSDQASSMINEFDRWVSYTTFNSEFKGLMDKFRTILVNYSKNK